RFENVRAWCATQGKRHLVPFDAHGDLVLRTSERKADSYCPREQRALGKFFENIRELLSRDRSVVIGTRGQRLARGNERDRAGATPPDPSQHGDMLACAAPV